jgi:hypothetical protein
MLSTLNSILCSAADEMFVKKRELTNKDKNKI